MMATVLGATPCTASQTAPKVACSHNLTLRHRCPVAFQSNRKASRAAKNRPARLVVRAAAATEQNVKMPSWEQMHKQLTTQHNLESVSASDAKKLVDSGKFVLIDVRPPDIYAKAHPEGAQSAPLFQSVNWSKPDFKKYLRAVAFMANGVTYALNPICIYMRPLNLRGSGCSYPSWFSHLDFDSKNGVTAEFGAAAL